MTNRKVMQQALEALNLPSMKTQAMLLQRDEAITALREALEQPKQEPHSYCYVQRGTSVDILTFDDMPQDAIAGTIYPLYAAPQPESCQTCVEIHLLLDADESMIIRNARDGYPEGRPPRELTLLERVKSLCTYAADWKRWCIEAQTPPAAQPEPVAYYHPHSGFYWAKPTSIFAPTVVDVPPMPLYVAAERNK